MTESFQDRTSLPLAGQIAAGSPVVAVEDTERVDFSDFFGADHFCLKVKDDSMADDLLSEGDFVIVKRQNRCKDGEIVVALANGQASVKRIFHERNGVRLEPANGKPTYAKNVDILGVVVGVIRRC